MAVGKSVGLVTLLNTAIVQEEATRYASPAKWALRIKLRENNESRRLAPGRFVAYEGPSAVYLRHAPLDFTPHGERPVTLHAVE